MQLSGVKAHIWQRISAVYLLLFFPYLAWHTSQFSIESHPTLAAWLQQLFTPLFSILSLFAILLFFSHAWVGVRDIIIDYIPRERVNAWLKAYAIFLLILAADIIWLASLLLT